MTGVASTTSVTLELTKQLKGKTSVLEIRNYSLFGVIIFSHFITEYIYLQYLKLIFRVVFKENEKALV